MFLFVLDRMYISVKDVFVCYKVPLTRNISQRIFSFTGGCIYAVDETLVALYAPNHEFT